MPPVRGKPVQGVIAVLIHRRITHQPETLKTDIQTLSVSIVLDGTEVLISAIHKPLQAILTTTDLDLLTESTDWQISVGVFKFEHPLWNSHTTNAAKTLYYHV